MSDVVVEKIVKRFGSTTAVDGIDLRMPAGKLFFLLGPAGFAGLGVMAALTPLNVKLGEPAAPPLEPREF